MITLSPSNPVELSNFVSLEQDPDAAIFVSQNSLKEHLKAFFDPSIIYLTIEKNQHFAGFILLSLDVDEQSVELRRIIIAERGSGVGQQAMKLLESYVREQTSRSRIWLDVFTNNYQALHVYRKLGYEQFDTAEYGDGRPLLLFEKLLS